MPLKATGPLEAGLRRGDSIHSPVTKTRLRAALSGLEDKYLAEQAELGILSSIEKIGSANELEQILRQLLNTDTCSAIASRHRYRSRYQNLHICFELVMFSCKCFHENRGLSEF